MVIRYPAAAHTCSHQTSLLIGLCLNTLLDQEVSLVEHTHTRTHTNLVVCVYLAKFIQILFLFDFVLGCFVFTVVFVVVVTFPNL